MNKRKKNKIYMDAIKYFEEGQIDKAIIKCEEGISKDLKDKAVLNLKGLLLYLKGDLNGAVTTWKINYDFNDDKTSKNYIEDAKRDEVKTQYYNKAEKYLKNLELDNAINELKKCTESDFNKIKVNLSLAICYLKKANYPVSAAYLTKVLELDKDNKLALEISKQLKKYGDITLANNSKNKKLAIVIASITFVSIITIAAITIVMNGKTKVAHNNDVISSIEKPEENVIDTTENEADKENVIEDTQLGEDINVALVNVEEIESLINSKSYDQLANVIGGIDSQKLQGKEEAIYNSAINLLKSNEAIDYYYEKATELYDNSDYNNAYNEYKKIYDYGKDNYLFQHSLYFMGVAKELNNEKIEAIKFYEEYYDTFKDGTYIEQILYSLADLFKDEDLEKCRKYAEELKYDYSDSIYNNDKISNILEQLN